MKLQTSIKPRREGVVNLVGKDGVKYTFKPDENGALVCDVKDAETVQHVLISQPDHFWPFDDADYQEAEKLLEKAELDDGDEDEGDEASNPGGLPVEANTPPKTAPDKAAKANAALRKAAAAAKKATKEPAAPKKPRAKKATAPSE